MKKNIIRVLALLPILAISSVNAIPFDTSSDVMQQMVNEENKPLVKLVSSYTNAYKERQSLFIKDYGKTIITLNKKLVDVEKSIVTKYNVKDEDGDEGGDRILDNKDFDSSRESFDLNKILAEKKKIKNELIIQYFKKEVQVYKAFINDIDSLQVSPKIKMSFKINSQDLTKKFVNQIPQNISISIRKENDLMKDQNPIVTLRMQRLLDLSYVSMLDDMNQSLDMVMTDALLKSLTATPKLHTDPIKK